MFIILRHHKESQLPKQQALKIMRVRCPSIVKALWFGLWFLPALLILYLIWPLLLGKPYDEPPELVAVLTGFNITNCGHIMDPLKIQIIHVELKQGKMLSISFSITNSKKLKSPLQLNVIEKFQVLGGKWQNIPCDEVSSSCLIKDLCLELKCPALRREIDPAMGCPLSPGTYIVPEHYIHLTYPQRLVRGMVSRYIITHNDAMMACYDIAMQAELL